MQVCSRMQIAGLLILYRNNSKQLQTTPPIYPQWGGAVNLALPSVPTLPKSYPPLL